jgi:hypothetical protein
VFIFLQFYKHVHLFPTYKQVSAKLPKDWANYVNKIFKQVKTFLKILSMKKSPVHCIILITTTFIISCNPANNSNNSSIPSITDFSKTKESFSITTGLAHFDILPSNLNTHKLDSGGKRIFIYERTGVTMIDANDWEAKYTETLIFQIDSTINQFEYCDSDLSLIDCRYYWICLANEIKKEIRNVKQGCIKFDLSKDLLSIDIDVNSGFRFGGILEKDNDRVIKYGKSTRR